MPRMTQAEFNAYQARRNIKSLSHAVDALNRANGCVLEIPLHDQIIEHCYSQWPQWKYIRARSDMRSTIAKGAQDFTIFMPNGRTLCVECKSASGKLDIDQRDWSHEMKSLGHVVHVVRSFDEFLKLL